MDGDEYLLSFVSKPTFGKNSLAVFDSFPVHNKNGIRVNVLQTDHTYTLSFLVKFNRDVEDIFFGAEFLTLKGNLLSSVDTKYYKSDRVYSIKNKDSYEVNINFECLLLPEVFVINVYAKNEAGGLTIHDAYIFKVKPSSWHQGGLVHLKQKINVKKLNE